MSQSQNEPEGQGEEPDELPEEPEDEGEVSEPEFEQVIAFTKNPGDFDDEEVDTLIYSGEGDPDLEGDDQVNIGESGEVEIGGVRFVLDNHSDGINLDDPDLLEEEPEPSDFYSDDELEEYAEELSGYNGPGAGWPIIGSLLERFFGSKMDPEDLTLEDIPDPNEEHQNYLEAKSAYDQAKEELYTDERTVIVGEENGLNQMLMENGENIDGIVTQGQKYGLSEEGYLEPYGAHEESDRDEPSEEELVQGVGMLAMEQGGVEEAYDQLETQYDNGEIEEDVYSQAVELRPEVEEFYEEIERQEGSQEPESPGQDSAGEAPAGA